MLFPSEAFPTIGAEDHVLDSLVIALESLLRAAKLLYTAVLLVEARSSSKTTAGDEAWQYLMNIKDRLNGLLNSAGRLDPAFK
jgi:hypothetical protein